MLNLPVERHELPNGLRVILSPDTTLPVVAVNLWYFVGSRNEPEGLTGFAHLFEHMMFQGSEHVPKNGHFELVERAGGSLNGSTWFDRTNYFETLPAHHLDLGLWLESDRMGWLLPAMTQEKLDNQRDVVKNEKRWRYDNQPYGDWDERVLGLVYPPSHPYHHTVIGSMEDLDAASLDDVRGFFRTFYLPNNAVLTLCGDFEVGDALERIREHFAGVEKGDPPPPLPGTPHLDETIGATVDSVVVAEVPLPRTYVAFRIPTFTDDRFPVAEVVGEVLGTGKASRLYRSLVREQRIAKDVVSYVFPLVTGAALAVVWATAVEGVPPDRLRAAILEQLDGLDDLRQTEVDRAVSVSETRLLAELEKVGTRADLLSMFETLRGDAAALNSEIDRLRAVTVDEAREHAARFLGPDNRAVLTYVPEEAS